MSRQRHDDGFALVAVLCWSMLLSLAAGAILMIAKTQADGAAGEMKAAQLTAIADAGIRLAILSLTSPDGNKRLNTDGTPFSVRFAGTDIIMSVADEHGKVDLNAAPFPLLARLFGAAGLTSEAATAEANRILDWRERGSLKRLNGGKQDDYRQLGFAYGPRQASFQSVGEVRLVLGFNDTLLAKIEPALTVASQESEIDWPVAGHVTSALMLPSSRVTHSPLDQGLRAMSQPHAPQRIFGRAFVVRAEASAGSYAVVRTASIRINGNPRSPVSFYFWR